MLLLVLCGIIGAVIFWHKIKRKQSPKLFAIKAEKSFNPSRCTIIDAVYLSLLSLQSTINRHLLFNSVEPVEEFQKQVILVRSIVYPSKLQRLSSVLRT